EHARIGRTEADKLEPELPRLTLVAAKGGKPTAIELDGAPLTSRMWSEPMPLDPGPHELAVAVTDARVWRKTVTIDGGERTSVDLPFVPVEATPAPPVNDHRSGRNPPIPPNTDAQRTWAFVLGGVGAAAVVTGVALFTSARLEYDGAGGHCT